MSGQDSVTSKERAAFERWLHDVHGLSSTWQAERNCYKDFPAHLAFCAWKEARASDEPCDALLEHGTASDEAIVLLLRYRDLLVQCDCDPRDVDRECNYCRTVSLLAHLGVAEYADHPDYRVPGSSQPLGAVPDAWVAEARELFRQTTRLPPSVSQKHIDAALAAIRKVDPYIGGGAFMLARQNLNIAISNLEGRYCESATPPTKPETHIFCMGCKQPVPEGHECPSLGESGG
jgi:hypothetical protein